MGKTNVSEYDTNPLYIQFNGGLTSVQSLVVPIQTTFSYNWFWNTFSNVNENFFRISQ